MSYRKNLLVGIILVLGFTPVAAQSARGKASYYSKRATGARTASGQRLHHDSLTCAHRSYPFGTMLKVKNLSNGREVTVKVTDRGPFGRGRIIDLSWGAAKALGMLAQGVAMVEVERLDKPMPPYRMEDSERGLPSIQFDMTGLISRNIDQLPRIPDNNLSAPTKPAVTNANNKSQTFTAEQVKKTGQTKDKDGQKGTSSNNTPLKSQHTGKDKAIKNAERKVPVKANTHSTTEKK